MEKYPEEKPKSFKQKDVFLQYKLWSTQMISITNRLAYYGVYIIQNIWSFVSEKYDNLKRDCVTVILVLTYT